MYIQVIEDSVEKLPKVGQALLEEVLPTFLKDLILPQADPDDNEDEDDDDDDDMDDSDDSLPEEYK